MRYYKLITRENKSAHGGDFDWTEYLPQDGHPGKWTPVIRHIEPCLSGYHLTDENYICDWISDQLFEAEFKGNTITRKGKIVCQSVRLVRKVDKWDGKTLILFACWCIRQIWHLLSDERSKYAIEIVEKYIKGDVTHQEIKNAYAAAIAVANAYTAAYSDTNVARAARAVADVVYAAVIGADISIAYIAHATAACAVAIYATTHDADVYDACMRNQNEHLLEMIGETK